MSGVYLRIQRVALLRPVDDERRYAPVFPNKKVLSSYPLLALDNLKVRNIYDMLAEPATETNIAATQKEETLPVGDKSHPVPRVPGRDPRLRTHHPHRKHSLG